MPDSCMICNHPKRDEIENALLTMVFGAPPNASNSIEAIADQYSVSLEELKMHAMFHTPLVGDGDVASINQKTTTVDNADVNVTTSRDSLTRKIKLREADMLATVGREYLVTLKTMGRRINKLAQISSIDVEDEEKQLKLAKLLTKPMVDLYIGLGGEIRQTVKTMAELDRMLNGPEDSAATGLAALAQAIRRSDDLNG